MVDLTPPSSSANTPKREMDIDQFSSASEPGASDTELEEVETGQATPPLVEGEAGPSAEPAAGSSSTSKKSRRPPKDGLYESEIVQRWNKEIGDIFAQPAGQPGSGPKSPSKA